MANVIEIDRDDDIYVGIEFPLDHSQEGFFRRTKTIRQQVKSNIRNLLLTEKGERIFQPQFGSGLHDLLFQPATEKFEEDLETTINEAVAKWLPYVIVEDINIDISKEQTDNNQAKVSLKFRQQGDQTLDTLTFLVEE